MWIQGDGAKRMITALICIVLVTATIAIHYEGLRLASNRLAHLPMPTRMRIIVIIAAAFVSHICQVFIYALAYLVLCLLYTSPSPRDVEESRMPSSA